MKIGFIGAGQMGLPMVQRLVDAAHEVTVLARRDEVHDRCLAVGATPARDAAQAVRGHEVVVLCLFSDEQVEAVMLGSDGLLHVAEPGTLVVVHTTGSPAVVQALAEAGAARDIGVVDAPVSGSAEDIAAGRITVLLGGDEPNVALAEQVVGAYADPVLHIGPLGSAQLVKLLNNAVFAAQLQLVGQIERIAESCGIDLAAAAAAIQRSSGSSYAMGLVELTGSARSLAESAGEFLAKDVSVVQEVAAGLDLDLGVVASTIAQGPFTFRERTTT